MLRTTVSGSSSGCGDASSAIAPRPRTGASAWAIKPGELRAEDSNGDVTFRTTQAQSTGNGGGVGWFGYYHQPHKPSRGTSESTGTTITVAVATASSPSTAVVNMVNQED